MAESPSAEVGAAPGAKAGRRERTPLTALGWATAAAALAISLGDIVLILVNRGADQPPGLGNSAVEAAAAFAYGAEAVLGAVIVARNPSNAVGWVFCCGALVTAMGAAASEYAGYALITNPGGLPGGDVVSWLGAMAWWFGAGTVVTFGFLLYPDGRLPSPRWRGAAWLAAASLGVLLMLHALTPGPLYGEFSVGSNPIGIDAAAGFLRPARNLAWLLFVMDAVLGTAAVVVRLENARGRQRQELRWLACSGATVVVAMSAWALTHSERRSAPALLQGLLTVAVVAIPAAALGSRAKVARLQRSVARVVHAREEERRRLRRELHDGLAPTLAASVLELETVRGVARTDPATATEVIGRATDRIQHAIADVRRLVDDLRPASPDRLGPVEAVGRPAARAGAVADRADAEHRMGPDAEPGGTP